jgi:hypothetical protein
LGYDGGRVWGTGCLDALLGHPVVVVKSDDTLTTPHSKKKVKSMFGFDAGAVVTL